MLSTLLVIVLLAVIALFASWVIQGYVRAQKLTHQSSVYPKFERHLRVKGPYFDQGMVINKKTRRLEPQSKVSTSGAFSS